MVLTFLILLAVLAYAIGMEFERRRETPAADFGPCPGCGGAVEEDWLICPRCRKILKEPCPGCGAQKSVAHPFCPRCGGSR